MSETHTTLSRGDRGVPTLYLLLISLSCWLFLVQGAVAVAVHACLRSYRTLVYIVGVGHYVGLL